MSPQLIEPVRNQHGYLLCDMRNGLLWFYTLSSNRRDAWSKATTDSFSKKFWRSRGIECVRVELTVTD